VELSVISHKLSRCFERKTKFTVNLKYVMVESKATPATDRRDPKVCETSKLPHFLCHRPTDGGEVVSLRSAPGTFLLLISVTDPVDPKAIVR
jgi:hypothetical protein